MANWRVLSARFDGMGRPFEVPLVVEGVEHAEDVYADVGGSVDEGVDDVIGVCAVSHKALASEQHH